MVGRVSRIRVTAVTIRVSMVSAGMVSVRVSVN